MKYNKGFIGIGIIIAIVAALVVGGGAVYFATKAPTFPSQNTGGNNYQPQENRNNVSETSIQNNKISNVIKNSDQSLSTSCIDQPMGTAQQEGMPVITSLSVYSGSIGDVIEINGCNFSGFEGDKIATIKNSQGVTANIAGELGSTAKLLKIKLKSPLCQQDNSYSGKPCTSWLTLTPGVYKIYTMPWGKKSNELTFTINSSETQLKKFVREKYSFYAPKEWLETSVILSGGNSNGCELYSINYGGDGHRTGGSISIHTKPCFVSLKLPSSSIKENTEKNGYYIVAMYDSITGTTPSEELKTKEAYKKVVETFTLNNETMSVKVYFGDTIDAQSCFTPSYVERIIPKTTAVARASIEELLKGPTEAEKLQDRWTGLRSGINVKSISINNGIATLDLSTNLSLNDANRGTCGASIAIKQIEYTLKQFSTIKNVIIMVNGKPAENSIDP